MVDSDIDEEFHIPQLNESDDDSDKELQAAFKVGKLKPGIFRPITAPKPAINNKEGLLQKLEEIKQAHLEWIERMDVTVVAKRSEKLPNEEEEREFDVHNDFQREISFYEQAKESALIALERLHEAGIKTTRPDDYFAEMAKKDDHMKRVREKLLSLRQRRQAIERNKMNTQLKKFGKQVQRTVLKERQQKKKEVLNAVKKYRKGQSKSLDFLDDDDDSENVSRKKKTQARLDKVKEEGRASKKKKLGTRVVSGKRAYKNAKFGFGGKKSNTKWNDKRSFDNIRTNSKKKFGGKGKGQKNYRLGKNRRAKTKGKS